MRTAHLQPACRHRGLTLVELAVTVAIAGVLAVPLGMLAMQLTRLSNQASRRLALSQDVFTATASFQSLLGDSHLVVVPVAPSEGESALLLRHEWAGEDPYSFVPRTFGSVQESVSREGGALVFVDSDGEMHLLIVRDGRLMLESPTHKSELTNGVTHLHFRMLSPDELAVDIRISDPAGESTVTVRTDVALFNNGRQP